MAKEAPKRSRRSTDPARLRVVVYSRHGSATLRSCLQNTYPPTFMTTIATSKNRKEKTRLLLHWHLSLKCPSRHASVWSVSLAALSTMQITLHATRRTPKGASGLVKAMPAWSVIPRRAPARDCRGVVVYGITTSAMNDLSTPPPPRLSSIFVCFISPCWRCRRSAAARVDFNVEGSHRRVRGPIYELATGGAPNKLFRTAFRSIALFYRAH